MNVRGEQERGRVVVVVVGGRGVGEGGLLYMRVSCIAIHQQLCSHQAVHPGIELSPFSPSPSGLSTLQIRTERGKGKKKKSLFTATGPLKCLSLCAVDAAAYRREKEASQKQKLVE